MARLREGVARIFDPVAAGPPCVRGCIKHGRGILRGRVRKRTGMSRSMSRSRTSMRSTSMSRSSAPVDVSGGRARRPRHHPHPRRVVGAGGAREKPARGAAERRAMHGRRQRRAAMQYTREPCKRGATRNARVASSRRTGHRRRQIHCVYLRWPAVAGVKRPIARQQAARAGRVEDGGVLGHARVLEVSRCRSA